MGDQIKTFVYWTIAATAVCYFFLYMLTDGLASEEDQAYYAQWNDVEPTEEQVFHYLDSLGGEKSIWFFMRHYSYPEMLKLNLKLGLKSSENLNGEFEWEPDYAKILNNWAIKRDSHFLSTLKIAASINNEQSFLENWIMTWMSKANLPLKNYLSICKETENNTEAFQRIRSTLKPYSSQAISTLDKRLKAANIKAELELDESSGKILIFTKGWINEKAFRLLLESEGEIHLAKQNQDTNFDEDLMRYDRALQEIAVKGKSEVSLKTDPIVLENMPKGPLYSMIALDNIYLSYPSSTRSTIVYSVRAKDSIKNEIAAYMRDSLVYQYFPKSVDQFAWTADLNEERYERGKSELIPLHKSSITFNSQAKALKVQRGRDGYYDVFFQLNKDYSEKWNLLTQMLIFNDVAFLVDDEIIQNSIIEQMIFDGKVVLYGGFSKATADALAALIQTAPMNFGGKLKAKKWGYPERLGERERQNILFFAMTIAFIVAFLVIFIKSRRQILQLLRQRP
jgi:hypothetical protein